MKWERTDFWGKRVDHQRLGFSSYIGATDRTVRNLYRALRPSEKPELTRSSHGGIFNLSFSPDGSILVAATEGKSILVFDPLCHRQIKKVEHAHRDCINYARFLDSRMFATCSDDTTVALWDVRNLHRKIRSLVGHCNWVKNIEYACDAGLLVTSGFDGSIHTWDINKFSETGTEFQRIFYTNGLMRMRLTPDNQKMVICTTGGYLVVIHDLDLQTLAHDLRGFQLPRTYRWKSTQKVSFHTGDCRSHHFPGKRNRVELICDFPRDNEAEIISSLQVHPHGWCVLSRNTSRNEKSEWTCVHDIQGQPPLDDSNDTSSSGEEKDTADSDSDSGGALPNWHLLRPRSASIFLHTEWEHWMPEVWREPQEMPESRVFHVSTGAGHPSVTEGSMEDAVGLLPGPQPILGLQPSSWGGEPNHRETRCKVSSMPRLLYYTQELNRGRGWIKELCFSTDGRLVCSPLERGVRLLAFDADLRELSDCVPQSPPKPLVHMLTNTSHSNYVALKKLTWQSSTASSPLLGGRTGKGTSMPHRTFVGK